MEGRISFIAADSDFGFVKPLGSAEKIYFKAEQLCDLEFTSALVGVLVEFDPADSPQGLRAVSVRQPLFPPTE